MSLSILYIEDDSINAYVLRKMLSNFEVDIATTGNEGMEKAGKKDYDLVLMDINLGDPEKDGIHYMHELRNTRYANKPIVAVTAYAMSGDRERFMEEGFDEYFSKPVEKLRLILFLEKHKKSLAEKAK